MSGFNYRDLLPSDEEELTEEIKDHVSLSLNDDWKKFAYNVLTDEEIERIDADESKVTEKCNAVFKLWNEKCDFPVTRALLKIKLFEIGRRDILYELANAIEGFGAISFPEQPKARKNISTNKTTKGTPNEEITVTELRMYQVDKLKSKLDICYGSSISNWKHLAYELLGDDPSLQNEIKDLELHYYGGGNPALEFFRKLSASHPEVSVDDFRQKSKIFHRNDIVETIDKLLQGRDPKKLKVKDLNMKAKESLASLMNLNIPGVYNWEMFADEYGYKYVEISTIKATIKEGQSFSPTTKLFELLKKVRPQMRISQIKEKCVFLGRNDVAQLIDDIMREKAT